MTREPGVIPGITLIVATSPSHPGDARPQPDLAPGPDGIERVVEPIAGGDVGQAWNRGAGRARGALLLFLRAGVQTTPGLVGAHVEIHRRYERAFGLGTLGPDRGGDEPRPGEFCGHTCSITRTEFSAAGGFMEGVEWGAEAELAHRLEARGLRLVRARGELGQLPRPAGLSSLAAERAAAGRGSVALYRMRPELLPELELGAFGEGRHRARLLRRTLLALGAPLWPVRLATILTRGDRRESWQRFLESYLYWRGVWQSITDRDTRTRLVHSPMILMYHAIGEPSETPGRYIVPLRRFKMQLLWLRLAGYRIIGVEEILQYRRAYRLPPPRTVAITFDDGYLDNHRMAWPVLRQRGIRAMFFLVSRRIGETNRWDRAGELAGRPLMSWDAASELIRSGMEVGAHSRGHPALPGLPIEACDDEISGSRADIEGLLGVPVRVFAYPYGLSDDVAVGAAVRAGYEGACGTRSGANDPAVPAHRLRRLEIRGTDTLFQFALSLWRRSRR